MTFSLIAFDPETKTTGSAIASKWPSVGACVPYYRPGAGLIHSQNHSFAPLAEACLENLSNGMTPQESMEAALAQDAAATRRQCIICDTSGNFHLYSGADCTPPFTHMAGQNCAAAGNTLAGEDVVRVMIAAYEAGGTKPMAERLLDALDAAQDAGGDRRGQEAAAVKIYIPDYPHHSHYPVDIRVDDHTEPFIELGRLLNIAQMNYAWNEAWTLFSEADYIRALEPMERAARLAPDYGEVHYDLACIRLAVEDTEGAIAALRKAIELNPKLVRQAAVDDDLSDLRGDPEFEALLNSSSQ